MVRCPSCSRANGDERHACVYCGTELVDRAAIALETEAELLAPRPRGRRGLALALLPGQDSPAHAESIASLLQCEVFRASQLLRRIEPVQFPCANEEAAAALAGQLRDAGLRFVQIDYRRLDVVPDASLLLDVVVGDRGLTLTPANGDAVSMAFDDIACVIVGRVEVEATREELETRFRASGDGQDVHRVETRTNTPDYDAYTVFDLYGASGLRVRLLESVTTIDGRRFRKTRRGAGFTRFARWLGTAHPHVFVDERYVQLGKEDRRVELTESDRILSHGWFRTKEVLGTEESFSGQDFDDYSVTAWTVWCSTKS